MCQCSARKLGLLFALIIIICLTLLVSCVSKEVAVTETYYETDYRTEEYTDIIQGEDEIAPEKYWYCENLVMTWQPAVTEDSSSKQNMPRPRSYKGVWYLGYKLPQHNASKIVIQTLNNETGLVESCILLEWCSGDEMVSAYDMTNAGHIAKPPFDKPLYVIYRYVGPYGYELPPKLNVYSYEEQQFNEWLDQFDVQLTNSHLGTQFRCNERQFRTTGSGRTILGDITFSTFECDTLEYEFDTTGVRKLAIIIAGGEYRGKSDSEQMGYTLIPSEPSNDQPIRSIKLIWSDEVTKQREVSYQAEKQRTVMQTKKVPFWEAIFSK